MTCKPSDEEVWKDIPGYEGIYQINSNGDVKSLDRLDSKGRKRKAKVLSKWNNLVVLTKNAKERKISINTLLTDVFGIGTEELEDLDGEVWKDVLGYEGMYQVSNKGRVKSLKRVVEFKDGRTRVFPEKIRVQRLNVTKERVKKGGSHYYSVMLSKDDKKSLRLVHRLVAESFFGLIPEGVDVCHGMGGPLDNRVENLSFGTRTENNQDKIEQRKLDPDRKYKKLSVNDVREIRRLLAERETHKFITSRFNVSRGLVSKISCGATWRGLD